MGISRKIHALIISICILSGPIIGSSIIITPVQASTDYFAVDTYSTYNIDYTIDFNSTDASAVDVISWISRMENWTGVQDSQLLEIQLSSPVDTQTFDPEDIYNNSYDYFATELSSGGDSLRITFKYQVTLSAREWTIPENVTVGDYNQTSDLYQLYTAEQIGCEVNDPDIQTAATNLVGSETSITKIAQAIYLYVISNLNYQIMQEALGAASTIDSLTGDCSEFSSLMVCLLRAAGIPARKVLGLGLVEGDISEASPKFDTNPGDIWSYSSPSNGDSEEVPGHAWLQYFVPEIGWVSCDPTWGQALYESGESRGTAYAEEQGLQYFNRIDHVHLITSVGDFYGDGIDPSLIYISGESGLLEFPFHYTLLSWTQTITNQELDLTSTMMFQIEVEDSNYVAPSGINPSLIQWAMYLSGAVLIFIVFLALIAKRAKNKKNRSQHTYYK